MKSLSKVRRAISLGLALTKVSQQTANQIASWGLVLSGILLLVAEEHARRTWIERALSAQVELAKANLEISALRLAAIKERGAK